MRWRWKSPLPMSQTGWLVRDAFEGTAQQRQTRSRTRTRTRNTSTHCTHRWMLWHNIRTARSPITSCAIPLTSNETAMKLMPCTVWQVRRDSQYNGIVKHFGRLPSLQETLSHAKAYLSLRLKIGLAESTCHLPRCAYCAPYGDPHFCCLSPDLSLQSEV